METTQNDLLKDMTLLGELKSKVDKVRREYEATTVKSFVENETIGKYFKYENPDKTRLVYFKPETIEVLEDGDLYLSGKKVMIDASEDGYRGIYRFPSYAIDLTFLLDYIDIDYMDYLKPIINPNTKEISKEEFDRVDNLVYNINMNGAELKIEDNIKIETLKKEQEVILSNADNNCILCKLTRDVSKHKSDEWMEEDYYILNLNLCPVTTPYDYIGNATLNEKPRKLLQDGVEIDTESDDLYTIFPVSNRPYKWLEDWVDSFVNQRFQLKVSPMIEGFSLTVKESGEKIDFKKAVCYGLSGTDKPEIDRKSEITIFVTV